MNFSESLCKCLDTCKDMYYLKMGNEGFNWVRPLIVNGRKHWKFVGVLHEYLESVGFVPKCSYFIDNYFINSGKFGNRSSVANKYELDAYVLENAYENETDEYLKSRYAFYCGQSYRDCGNLQKSLKWYTIRTKYENIGYHQELYVSYLQIGHLCKSLGNIVEALDAWGKCTHIDLQRCESLYYIMNYYREKGDNINAYKCYSFAFTFNGKGNGNSSDNVINPVTHCLHEPIDFSKLFVCTSIYNFYIFYELSIVCYYSNDYKIGMGAFQYMYENIEFVPVHLIENIISNFKLYIDKFKSLEYSLYLEYVYEFQKNIF